MATLIASVPIAVSVSDVAKALPLRRRRITPERGRALEKLSHAIEYLVDEQFIEGCSSQASSDLSDSIHLLCGLRQQVYMDAPEIQPISAKLRLMLAGLLP
jgi:hypothetical protein